MISLTIALLLAGAQQQRSAPALTPDLLFAHPALLSGDFEVARSDWLAALEADPRSPLAWPAVASIGVLADFCADEVDTSQIERLCRLVDDGRALEGLVEYQQHLVRRSIFRAEAPHPVDQSQLDFVASWFVMGPVGALDDAWPLWNEGQGDQPHHTWSTSYPSSFGTQLTWRPHTSKDGWVEPDELVFPARGIVYQAAWIDADLDEAQLEITTQRAVEVFWNGRLVARELRGGTTDSASRVLAPVRFARGHNALVLRLEGGEFLPVRARILSHDGRVYRGAVHALTELSTAPAHYPTSAPATPLVPTAIDAGPSAGLLALALALSDGRADRALAVQIDPAALDSDLERAGALRLRHLALASAHHLPAEVSRRLRIEVEERVAALGVDLPQIELARAARLLGEDRPQEAVTIARALVAAHPRVPAFRRQLEAALGELDSTGVLERLARDQASAAFDNVSALVEQVHEAESRRDPVAALALARKLAELDGSYGGVLLDQLADGDASEQAEALVWIARWRAVDADTKWLDGIEQRIWTNMGRHDLVEAALRQAVGDAPYLPEHQRELADHLRVYGDLDAARASYQSALDLDPSDRAARDALTALGVEDPAEAFFLSVAPDRDAALASARAFVGKASTVTVLNARSTYDRADGSSRTRYHHIALAVDHAGTESLHEQTVVGEPLAQRVIAPDGTVFEPTVVDGKWVMPALEPGSLVETLFEFDEAGLRGVAPELGIFEFASFDSPVLMSELAVFVPTGLPGEFVERQFSGSHTRTPAAGGEVHVFKLGEQELLLDEPLRPSDGELLPWVAFGADSELATIAATFKHDSAAACDVAADIALELRAFVATVQDRADPQFLPEALHRALAEHVIDFRGDGDTTDVWTLKRGDPLGLLAALYEIEGIGFEWVVTQPGVAPALVADPSDPFFDASDFGYVGLRLAPPVGGTEPIWLLAPPGARGFPFGRVPAFLHGASVVVLGASGPRRETLPEPEGLEQVQLDIEVRLQPDESAIVHATLRMSDVQGPLIREALLQAEPNQREQYIQQMAAQTVTGLDVESAHFEGLEVRGNDLVLVLDGRIDDFVKGTLKKPNFKSPWPRFVLSSAFGRGNRRWPVALRALQVESGSLRVVPCDTWSIDAKVGRSVVDHDGLHYVLDIQLDEDGVLTIERRFGLTGLELPAAEAASVAAELKSVEELDNARIDLIPRASGG